MAASSAPHCAVCGAPAERLKCTRCKTAYCSATCQTVDWKERGHKTTCKRLVKAAADEAREEAPAVPAAHDADLDEPTRCPVCRADWDRNAVARKTVLPCCCREVCTRCAATRVRAAQACPLCGGPTPRSPEETLAMIRRQADLGNPRAVRHLGHAYKHGEFGLKPSAKKAAQLWQRAADLGDLNALFNVGSTYLKGEGVKLDKKKAVRHWRAAADRGLAKAQFNLGLCFRKGDGVAVDDAEAARLWARAAELGDVDAARELGVLYASGSGVATDMAAATRWWRRAANRGDASAREFLARFAHLRTKDLAAAKIKSGGA